MSGGTYAVPDYANPEQMNRYVWYQSADWKKPYPGDRPPPGSTAGGVLRVFPPGRPLVTGR